MTVYLGIDDTDIPSSRGTGRLARQIAARLSCTYTVSGVTRHQLYVHPSIPYTSHNSTAVIHIETDKRDACESVLAFARQMILDDHIEGSDPGIAVALKRDVSREVYAYGQAAKTTVLTQNSARELSAHAGILLEGLAGTCDGVIGALAGIGLAASGNDGRFVQKGSIRDLRGEQAVESILHAGIDSVATLQGETVAGGIVHLKKFPKPAFVQGRAVLFVEPYDDGYRDLVVG